MPKEVIMPSLGESVVEGTITRWLKSPGEPVEEYEPLLEVNTDKVDSEIPSPATGVLLEVLAPEGATINAGTLLAWIGEPGEAPADAGQASASPEPIAAAESPKAAAGQASPPPGSEVKTAPPVAPATGRSRELGFISPVVARIAGEHQIDLYQVQGTGLGGRITKKDVLAYLERGEAAQAAPPAQAPAPSQAALPAQAAPPAQAISQVQSLPGEDGEVIPFTPVRRAIAEHMVHSKHTSPHVTTVMEVDLKRVVEHRSAQKDSFARSGVNLTFTAYFVAAAVAALRAYPLVNSSWTEEGIRIHKGIHIGIATSLGEAGLIVPVIKNADQLSLLGLAQSINDLANRARNHQLKPEEVKGGTFTITNHGTSGSLFATPIINQPQCAILGVGVIQKRVVVLEDDAIAVRPMVYLSLTFDHRILDGATGDQFLGKVVESLRNWQG